MSCHACRSQTWQILHCCGCDVGQQLQLQELTYAVVAALKRKKKKIKEVLHNKVVREVSNARLIINQKKNK